MRFIPEQLICLCCDTALSWIEILIVICKSELVYYVWSSGKALLTFQLAWIIWTFFEKLGEDGDDGEEGDDLPFKA